MATPWFSEFKRNMLILKNDKFNMAASLLVDGIINI
jgi:hypothetical protein